METAEQIITVEPGETLDSLLAQVAIAPGPRIVVRVPREAPVPGAIEDFLALQKVARQRRLQIWVRSPVARVVGMAKIYGLEGEFENTAGARPAAPVEEQAPPALPPTAPPAEPPRVTTGGSEIDWLLGDVDLERLEAEAAAERGRGTPPPELVAPPPPVAPPVSENDWLMDGLDLEAMDAALAAERGHSAVPPPSDVAVPPPAPPPTPPPDLPSDSDWLLGGLDAEAIEAEVAAERGRTTAPPPDLHQPAPPASPPPLPAPPEPVSPPTPISAPPPTGPLPAEPAATQPELLDNNFLPEWLVARPATPTTTPLTAPVPEPAPGKPLFAHGPPTKPGARWVVPCPHCGEDIDFEQLISIAEYRD